LIKGWTEGKRLRSVCGRKRAPVYSFIFEGSGLAWKDHHSKAVAHGIWPAMRI